MYSQAELRVSNALLDLFEHLVAELPQRLSHVLDFLLDDF